MITKNKFQLIVVGTGAYVCGKKEDEYGTILPAILTYAKKFNLRITITFACNSAKGKENAEKKVQCLTKLVDLRESLNFEYVICDGDPEIFFSRLRNSYFNIFSIVSVPDQFHFKWISSLLKRDIATLTVKPLTLKYSEARNLLELSKQKKVPLFVEFHKRYDRQLRFARDTFKEGKIGIPLYSYTEYTQRKEIPLTSFRSWCDKTNIFSYLGVHYVDALFFVTGAKPLRVSSTGQKVFLKNQGINTFDSIQSSIIWEDINKNTFNQTILCSWIESNFSSAMSKQNFNLIGSLGRIDCEQKERGLRLLTDKLPTEEVNPDFTKMYKKNDSYEFEGYGIDSVMNFIHLVIESPFCTNDTRLCSVSDALISTSVIDAAAKSLENGSSWQEIDN